MQRAVSEVTGRKVPRASIARALEGCPVAFSVLAPLVDVAVEVRTPEQRGNGLAVLRT